MTTTAQHCSNACRQHAFHQRRKQETALVVQPTVIEDPAELPLAWRTPVAFEGRQVRITTDEHGVAWFIAADVCAALDLGNSGQALARLDDDEKGVVSTDTPGGTQSMATVNELGLYSLVLGSRKPEAKRFKRWVTHEVFPAIRRTGRYSTQPAPRPLPLAPGVHIVANSPRHARWLWGMAVEQHVSSALMAQIAARRSEPSYQLHLLPPTSAD